MADLRKKYKTKAVKISELKNKIDKEDSMSGSSSREEYLDIEVNGKTNKFRFFPPHDGPDFYIMRKRYWMESLDDQGDAKKRVINDSILHGGTKYDIIQEYVKYCTENIEDKDKISLLTHWKNGIKAQIDYVAYALKISGESRDFGLLSIKKKIRDEINKLIFVEDEDDDPIEVDPFTDVDDGLPLLIVGEKKKAKGSKKEETVYTVTTGKKAIPLTDEELEHFEKVTPLSKLYRDSYTIKDFEKAIECLKYFDSENEFDIFEEDDWLEICEKVKSQYDEIDEEEDEDEKPKSKKSSNKKVEKKAKKVQEDDEDESDEDEEEEEVKPKKKAKKIVDDDDEDEDEEEEEVKPKKKPKKVVDEDEDDEDDEDEDEKPRKRMSLADVKAKLKGKK